MSSPNSKYPPSFVSVWVSGAGVGVGWTWSHLWDECQHRWLFVWLWPQGLKDTLCMLYVTCWTSEWWSPEFGKFCLQRHMPLKTKLTNFRLELEWMYRHAWEKLSCKCNRASMNWVNITIPELSQCHQGLIWVTFDKSQNCSGRPQALQLLYFPSK